MADGSSLARAIGERLEVVQEQLALACQRVGRSSREVTLVAVTKTFAPAVVEAALQVGLQDLGENKMQELVAKAASFPDARWHMIGHLQRNKARDAALHAHMFHALDSLRLARTLNVRAAQIGRTLTCCVQVNVSGEETKFGLHAEQVAEALRQIAELPYLRIAGLMTLAAPTDNPESVRPQFRLLRELLDSWDGFPERPVLSMGMSSDFEVAIEEGATHIRLGSSIFGPRHRP